jgi:hypothetical protein
MRYSHSSFLRQDLKLFDSKNKLSPANSFSLTITLRYIINSQVLLHCGHVSALNVVCFKTLKKHVRPKTSHSSVFFLVAIGKSHGIHRQLSIAKLTLHSYLQFCSVYTFSKVSKDVADHNGHLTQPRFIK